MLFTVVMEGWRDDLEKSKVSPKAALAVSVRETSRVPVRETTEVSKFQSLKVSKVFHGFSFSLGPYSSSSHTHNHNYLL